MISKQALMTGSSGLIVASLLASLALTGCKPQQTAALPEPPMAALPLTESDPGPIAPAPAARDLAPAPPSRIGRPANSGDRYAYADRAYAMTSAFDDSPPDYMFDYGDGERPWVWRGDDRSMRMTEPVRGGSDRYYYYEPGSQTPYFVRDEDYGYGYDDGALAVVYDRNGRAMPPDSLTSQAGIAGRLLARALALYQASQQQQRQSVAEANWAARRNQISAERARLAAAQAEDQEWQDYHAQRQREEDAYWAAERSRREAQAQRYARADQSQRPSDRNRQGSYDAAPIAPPPPPRQPRTDTSSPPPFDSNAARDNRDRRSGEDRRREAAQVQDQEDALARVAAARRAETQAADARQKQIEAQRQAQIDAQARARAESARQAEAQAADARQKQIEAQRQAQADTQARARAEAARQAEAQAADARQKQIETQRQAQVDAQARARAEAARQAEAQAADARQKQIETQRQAQLEAQTRARAEEARQAAQAAEAAEAARQKGRGGGRGPAAETPPAVVAPPAPVPPATTPADRSNGRGGGRGPVPESRGPAPRQTEGERGGQGRSSAAPAADPKTEKAPPRASATIAEATAAGATAKCKDGDYTMSKSRPTACSDHGGVDIWLLPEPPAPDRGDRRGGR